MKKLYILFLFTTLFTVKITPANLIERSLKAQKDIATDFVDKLKRLKSTLNNFEPDLKKDRDFLRKQQFFVLGFFCYTFAKKIINHLKYRSGIKSIHKDKWAYYLLNCYLRDSVHEKNDPTSNLRTIPDILESILKFMPDSDNLAAKKHLLRTEKTLKNWEFNNVMYAMLKNDKYVKSSFMFFAFFQLYKQFGLLDVGYAHFLKFLIITTFSYKIIDFVIEPDLNRDRGDFAHLLQTINVTTYIIRLFLAYQISKQI